MTPQEENAAALRDATLAELLAWAAPWDVQRVKAVILAAAREDPAGEVSANTVRDLLDAPYHWLIGPAFNALGHSRMLYNTGRKVPSTSPPTKGHGVAVYRITDDGRAAAA